MDNQSYGKMPVWQWVVIYLLVGGIIYGLFYSFVLYKNQNRAGAPYGNQPPMYTEPVDDPNRVEVNEDSTIAEVELTEEGFVPSELTVEPGTTVTWKNVSGGVATVNSADHPTHQLFAFLNLGEFEDGSELTLTFDEVGTYSYHNHYSPGQGGTIVVERSESEY